MATLEQIHLKMKHLREQADALIAKGAQAAVDQIRELMLKHGLTTADIETNAKAKRDAKARATKLTSGANSVAKGKLPAKYMNPKTGETWSGHARPPAWIKDAKNRKKFLIASSGAASTATKRPSASGLSAASKGEQKGPQPAKYRDPNSGATWSGRGRAPAWLAGAKDRRKFLIDADLSDSSNVTVARKPAKSKSAVKTAAFGKKVATKK